MSAISPSLGQQGADAPRAAALYVATDGNDAWSGTLAAPNAEKTDGPLATLKRARNAVRERRQRRSDRQVVVLRKLEELGWAEIARRLEKSEDACRMLLARAMAALTIALETEQ